MDIGHFQFNMECTALGTAQHFVTERIHRFRRHDDTVEAECIRSTDQAAEIARILDIIQNEHFITGNFRRQISHSRHHPLRGFKLG